MDDGLKKLLGSSVMIPELDPDEQEQIINDSIVESIVCDIIDSIGTDKFQVVFTLNFPIIKNLPIETQIVICRKILDGIKDEYDIEFDMHKSDDLLGINDVIDVYKLCIFIEYQHTEFLADLFIKLNIDLRGDYSDWKVNLLFSRESILSLKPSINFGSLVNEFFTFYSLDEIVKLIISMTEKNKMDILVKIIEKKDMGEVLVKS